ncbi:MAG: hypothetical protein ABR905_22180 [Terracidiphilus sp.]
MEHFSAAAFMFISRSLADLRVALREIPADRQLWPNGVGSAPSQLVSAVGERCAELGLVTSVRCVQDITLDIGQGVIASALIASLVELDNTVRREMSTHRFFHMPGSRAELYDQNELFGPNVNAKFPSIQYDMVEAGNCVAMGRGTAGVFHLMRIMEVGVQRFGDKLGVRLVEEKNWQNILDETNKAIKALPKDPATVEMSQSAANLYSVKLAWRNEVMHPKDTYTVEEAENLIGQVKLFMSQCRTVK